jgi:hypothetical protein
VLIVVTVVILNYSQFNNKFIDHSVRLLIMMSFAPAMGDSGEFICFIGDLKKELNNNTRYVKEISDNSSTNSVTQTGTLTRGLLCLSLHTVPTISVCCRVPATSTCRFFSLELTKDLLKEHVRSDQITPQYCTHYSCTTSFRLI